MDQIIKVAWELNENTDNRYKLVYEIAECVTVPLGFALAICRAGDPDHALRDYAVSHQCVLERDV